jgi:hypothetical protein
MASDLEAECDRLPFVQLAVDFFVLEEAVVRLIVLVKVNWAV